jgi:transposase-like protein
MLVGLLSSKLNMPKVVVTDRDNALVNVVAKVLPETDAILCYFHIGKNVRAKCITNCRVKAKHKDAEVDEKEVKEAKEEKHSDVVDKIMRAWKDLVKSPTEDSYVSALLKFKDVCKPFPKFLAYVETTILNTVKEKFVRAWTNKVLHLGCTTTNIVELAHGKLKKYLRNSVGDLASCWDEIDKIW